MISRHFVDVGGAGGTRRVHYRRCGEGPPLLLAHQSPRSSKEYERLMGEWGRWFTCVAPDTPGFGQSAPIGMTAPEVEDYADAAVAFMDAVGLGRVAAYGYHSGAITLVTAAKRHPERFSAVAANGYAVWTPDERAVFGARYTPPLVPSAYGEHLVWLWNRVLEQSWFFPWFAVEDRARLAMAHADAERVQEIALEMLESGDEYRLGYAAMLRANRDLPAAGGARVEVAIVASRPDPLFAHLERLGALPPGVTATGFDTAGAAEAAALAHLRAHGRGAAVGALAETVDEGFVGVGGGLLHWRGERGAGRVHLHGPGWSAAVLGAVDGLALDLPGHGMSDALGLGDDLGGWADVVAAAVRALGGAATVVGHGFAGVLAMAVAARLGCAAEGLGAVPRPEDARAWVEAYVGPEPDRCGTHLVRQWAAVRAGTFYWPWFRAGAANAMPFEPGEAAPERLRVRQLALAQARGGRALKAAIAAADWAALARGARVTWTVPEWARGRDDVWRP